MSFIYDRKETHEEITIVFKNHAAFYLILLAFFIIAFVDSLPALQAIVLPFFFIFLIVWTVGSWGVNGEIRRAMKSGKNVVVSGNKFSFKNPVTFIITK